MKNQIKNIIREITPNSIKSIFQSEIINRYENKLQYSNLSYSQEGEDMILGRIFEDKKNGFYIDVGAHHPQRFSNTMNFYKKGWRGINIDAMPGSMNLFSKERPEDINLELAVSDKEDVLTYYIFNQPAFNTFSETLALEIQRTKGSDLISKIEIRTQKLESILDSYMNFEQKIDFLSIDVEGFDLNVIRSNNWNKYRPEIVLVEIHFQEIYTIMSHSIFIELAQHGYNFIAKTMSTAFFKKIQ
jgi:FkbM family methyltransferase